MSNIFNLEIIESNNITSNGTLSIVKNDDSNEIYDINVTAANQLSIGKRDGHGEVYLEDTTTSTSSATGALVIAGGMGINENLNVLNDVGINGDLDVTGTNTLSAKCIGTAQTGNSSQVDYTNWVSVTTVGSVANWLTFTSTTFTITVAGDYIIVADVLWADASNGSERDCGFYLYLNSDVSPSASSRVNYVANADGATARATSSFTFLNDGVSANDTFKFKLQSLNAGTNDIVDTRLTIWKV